MKHSDMLKRLTQHRSSQAGLRAYVSERNGPLGARLEACGSLIFLRNWPETGETRVMAANFCRLALLCSSCAAARAAKLIAEYEPKIQELMTEDPRLRAALVSLTVANDHDLEERVNHLKLASKRMYAATRKARSNPSKNSAIEWSKVIGSIRSLEITKGLGGWHPHFHIFCLANEEISEFHLSAEWEHFCGDSHLVHVKTREDLKLWNVLSYTTKLSEMEPAEIWEAYNLLGGCRFVDPQGKLRGLKIERRNANMPPDVGPFRDALAARHGDEYHLTDVRTGGQFSWGPT